MRAESLGDFFLFVLVLVDTISYLVATLLYVLLVGGDTYFVKLVKVHVSWHQHHNYKKRILILIIFELFLYGKIFYFKFT